jgi:hypothetical protein
MKKNLLLLILMLLPLAASADAVEIDGIYYNLVPKAKIAEVTSNPNKYIGNVVTPTSTARWAAPSALVRKSPWSAT